MLSAVEEKQDSKLCSSGVRSRSLAPALCMQKVMLCSPIRGGFSGDQAAKDATGGHSTSLCGTCRLIRTTTLPFRRLVFITSDPILFALAPLAPLASGQSGVFQGPASGTEHDSLVHV
ncbi:hypothetical protein J3459_010427 [Metarhizium acridum]|uniref:uncharacterized protein n=1 Tax=Metarhizium acridum TaxID=92637 RepID=UPI001C6BB4DB|nr:hypothetical protein J3458_020771 [Metarhizium acridum]KAG8422377.1 hypothetical protein J3459_010427 [Metarhizium acridum]